MKEVVLGVIGGSGIYDIEGLENLKEVSLDTPYGKPSGKFLVGLLNNQKVIFLPRHGVGHIYSPSNVPYQANIYGMKLLGVTDLLSISACGSLREDFKPGEFVIIDQFIDRSIHRTKTFFDGLCVAHVSIADPVCSRIRKLCKKALKEMNVTFHDGGTYLVMEGPQFSTKAESLLYQKQWSCDVIGMTNMPEAKLAREAEICYASVAMVTDFDCWHEGHANVEVAEIIKTLTENASLGKTMVKTVTKSLSKTRSNCSSDCDSALEHAIISDFSSVSEEEKLRLGIIAERIFRR